jgi:hypothetical protein
MSEAQPTKTNQIWPCRFRFEIAFRRAFPILLSIPSTFDFCIPTRSTSVPDGPDWLHEVKYDGYRLRLERDGDRVRLITKGGYNWSASQAYARMCWFRRRGSLRGSRRAPGGNSPQRYRESGGELAFEIAPTSRAIPA